MTKADYIKCLDDLRAIRKRIKGDAKTVADLAKDSAALEAYRRACMLEAALDKLAPREG